MCVNSEHTRTVNTSKYNQEKKIIFIKNAFLNSIYYENETRNTPGNVYYENVISFFFIFCNSNERKVNEFVFYIKFAFFFLINLNKRKNS